MKIGILTQPLHNNYGGLLQAFALQKVLRDMGHEVVTVNIKNKDSSIIRKVLSVVKRIMLYILKGGNIKIRTWPTKEESKIISKNTSEFVRKYINVTDKVNGSEADKFLKKMNVDAFIVGSDQVWRPKYSPNLPSFFLDFVPKNSPIKCIAYAASFGVDTWEYNSQQTAMAKAEIRKFHAISVREDSAVELCDKYLGTKALHVLDPTLLLSKDDYIKIFNLDQIPESEGKLFTYVLDETPEKTKIIESISQQLDIKPFKVMPKKKFSEEGSKGIHENIYPPVENWLRAFMDADFVVTDSFHGTVFSIIFNKPFLTVANRVRGLSRFESLLRQFGLENRIIYGESERLPKSLSDSLNWDMINLKLNVQKNNSIKFLVNYLLPATKKNCNV